MIEIFYNKQMSSNRQYIAPNTINLYKRLDIHLQEIMNFFMSGKGRITSTHILYKILIQLGVNPNWKITDIIHYVNSNISTVSRPMNISNEIHVTLLPSNATIIKGAKEIIYLTRKYSTLDLLRINKSNWRKLIPLEFVNHSYRDLYFNHPTRCTSDGKNIISYTLDVQALLVMYKFHMLEAYENNTPTKLSSFVAGVVLTNSMYSFTNITILNNFLNKGHEYLPNRHTIGITSVPLYEDLLRKIIDKSLISREKDRLNIIEVMENVPLLSTNMYDQLMVIKDFYETGKSKRYLTVTVLDFVNYLTNFIDCNKDGNSQYYTKLAYYLKAMSRLHTITDIEIDSRAEKIIEELTNKIE